MALTSSCARTSGEECRFIHGRPAAPAVAPPLPSSAGVIPAATSAPAIDSRTTFALTVTAPHREDRTLLSKSRQNSRGLRRARDHLLRRAGPESAAGGEVRE